MRRGIGVAGTSRALGVAAPCLKHELLPSSPPQPSASTRHTSCHVILRIASPGFNCLEIPCSWDVLVTEFQ